MTEALLADFRQRSSAGEESVLISMEVRVGGASGRHSGVSLDRMLSFTEITIEALYARHPGEHTVHTAQVNASFEILKSHRSSQQPSSQTQNIASCPPDLPNTLEESERNVQKITIGKELLRGREWKVHSGGTVYNTEELEGGRYRLEAQALLLVEAPKPSRLKPYRRSRIGTNDPDIKIGDVKPYGSRKTRRDVHEVKTHLEGEASPELNTGGIFSIKGIRLMISRDSSQFKGKPVDFTVSREEGETSLLVGTRIHPLVDTKGFFPVLIEFHKTFENCEEERRITFPIRLTGLNSRRVRFLNLGRKRIWKQAHDIAAVSNAETVKAAAEGELPLGADYDLAQSRPEDRGPIVDNPLKAS
ncbi:hypothetical protein QFC20_006965 [Naganishia adeliensis]|uniref:Uncharacterized protein n=1 Tax=Naganishia adeliensis TaxID=92952 RepID=A0ACC2V588_9TREE|nr:hypothetical protein QFC20_006965 [Naganishia adeliensis]